MLKKSFFKAYNLNEEYGKNVQDNTPKYLDNLEEIIKMNKTAKNKNTFPFYGIDDPILNPDRLGLDDK